MSPWISSTRFFVRDVDTAIAFYVDVLGFTLNKRYEEEGKAWSPASAVAMAARCS